MNYTQNLYVGVDKLKAKVTAESGNNNPVPSVLGVMLEPSDGMVIRNNLIPLIKIVHVEQDVGIYHIGTIDMQSGEFVPCEKREVSHDAYQMPETTTNEKISDSLQQQQINAFLDRKQQ